MSVLSPGVAGPGNKTRGHRLRVVGLVLTGVVLFSALTVLGVQASTSISRGYETAQDIVVGSIVSLSPNTTDKVELATSANVDALLGVVINNESSLLSVKSDDKNQVLVATNGTAEVLVSDINGTIVQGDHVTASPISGIGMKATGNSRIIGVAQGDLSKTGVKQTFKDEKGQDQTAVLGEVPVLVNVAYYFKEPEKTLIPQALQNLANALAGKTVSSLPILISTGIFVIMLIVVATIVYSMIRGSIISVGRNPMSQSAVYRGVIQLSALVIVILGVGLTAMYLVLTRL